MIATATVLLFSAALVTAAPVQDAPATRPAPTADTAREESMMTFDFKDPKGVNGFTVLLDSPLEPMVGTGTGITGTVTFDPSKPTEATGTLALPTRSLQMTNSRMSVVLHGEDWLDAEKYPTLTLKVAGIESARPVDENVHELTAKVDVTIKDVTRTLTIPIRATLLPGRLGERVRGMTGDLLVLRSQFVIKRSDFNLKTDIGTDTVADEIQVTAAIVGVRPN